ncbi:MAG: DegV family EDD domain-containing protein [Myxococcaceae bacterium]|nr:DegV family EDD domain-containing protein [Myxococcaceae bacterium]
MRILTNPGSNLSDELALALDVDLTPQKIIVDGISHDTRTALDLSTVDRWVRSAVTHPSVQGTTRTEFAEHFARLAKKDPQILAIMTSRQIIGSHDAALAAVNDVKEATIEVVDTTVTDVGAGLVTLAAVHWRRAGVPMAEVARACRAFIAAGRNVVTVATLENLIKGGRASFLQGWVANFLNVRPLLSFEGGKPTSVGRVSARADSAARVDAWFSERLEPGERVWVGIAHGDAEALAQRTAGLLRERFKVEYELIRPLSPSIYLHVGRGSMGVFVYPLSRLPFELTRPSFGPTSAPKGRA